MSESPKTPNAEITSPPAPELAIPGETSNTVGLISLVLTLIAMGLCGVLFLLARNLPDTPAEFRTANATPAQLRVLILGCSTAVLTVVSLVLALIGMAMPGRQKTLPVLSAAGSVLILLGVFGVVVLGTFLANTAPNDGDSDSAVETSTELNP